MSLLLAACSDQAQLGELPSVEKQSGDEAAILSAAVSPTAEDAVRLIDPPAGPGAMAPDLTASRDGILLTWLEPLSDGGHVLYLSELTSQEWTPARQIAAGDSFFANWADLPSATEAADGTRFGHWLRKLGTDTYAYGAALARSKDGGETWQELGLLHDDTSPTEHGFVSYAPFPEYGVQAFWLDGRQMMDGGDMELRTVRLGDDGPEASTVLDDRVCECCATDAAMTADGPLVAYRDRGATEIRDIAVVRATAGGWSEPAVIHDDGWRIEGCPVNGPAVTAEGKRVAVAWFSGGEPGPRVAVAFSDDAGASFAPPIVVDDAGPLGRVDVAFDADGRAVVSWLGSTGESAEIRWRRVAPDGESGPVHVAATTTGNRSAGVPRMIRWQDQLLFAWVEDAEPSRLRVGVVSLGVVPLG